MLYRPVVGFYDRQAAYNPMNNIYYLRNQQWQRGNSASARSSSELRTASPSCRKTEPKHSQSTKRLPTQHRNTIQRSGYPSNSNRPAREEQPCSSIDRSPAIIHFRRVQQPTRTDRPRAADSRKEVSKGGKVHRKCESRATGRQSSQQEEPVEQIEPESASTFQGLYSLQPKGKLFLCQKCIAYLPVVEIKSHFAHCTAPKDRQQHLKQWSKIAQLLQEVNRVQPSSQLYTLAALMLAYAHSQPKESDSLLYSDELSRILAHKSVLSAAYLNGQQLFEVLERLGDRLQTAPRLSWPWCS